VQDADTDLNDMTGFRAIIGAAPLKQSEASRLNTIRQSFRAIIGAAPLKQHAAGTLRHAHHRFRAIIGAAPLKLTPMR